jgi:hypothetical protein
VDIYNNLWYLSEFPTMQEWCAKYTEWTPGTVRRALSDVRKAAAEDLIKSATGEEVIRIPKKTRNKSRITEVAELAVETSQEENKTNSSNGIHPIEDENGTVIPEPLIPTWNRRGEVQALMTKVKDLKSEIETLRESGEKPFGKIDQMVAEKLSSVYQMLKEAKPYVVCGECQGRLEVRKGFCKCCDSTGFMNEREYKLLVPEESRNIKKKENIERKLNEATRLSGSSQRQRA